MTQKPLISLVAAIDSKTRTIGKDGGGIPWKISEDFKYFKDTTMGHAMIMGRKTWEEFNGKPLPGRPHIIITSQKDYVLPENLSTSVFVTNSLEQALEKATEIESASKNGNKEIFIIGGAKTYAQSINLADRLYITLVDANVDGPAKFPEYKSAGFTKIISSRKSHDENFTYEFQIIEKA